MIVWKRPTGSHIITNEVQETINEAVRLGWKALKDAAGNFIERLEDVGDAVIDDLLDDEEDETEDE